MSWFYQLFFPAHDPTEEELQAGRRRIIEEGAVAGIIYALVTGNFLAGYLSYLGASVSFCAKVAMIPSLGCVLQFFSPFVFERMHHRKLAIWLMCVVFRLSVSSIFLIPLAMPDPGHARAVILVLYTIGFFSAGLVTPGLEHMVRGLSPQGGRGRFYAVKSIIGTCISSAATLALGRTLDEYLAGDAGYTGFLVIGTVSLVLSAADAVLLATVRENPVKFTSKMRAADILLPAKDPNYRPLLFYSVIGGLTGGFASPFLSVYTVSYGDYTEYRGREGAVTVLDGIRATVSPETEVVYARGCNFLGQALHPFDPGMLRDEDGGYGLTGRYYNGPVPEGTPVQVRSDRTINFNWIFSLPNPELDANCFSVAWTGSVIMPHTMDGCIGLSTQDSMRLYLDDELLIDGWGKDKSADQALDFHFEAGRAYKIRIEFVNDGRGARVIFGYSAGRENFSAAVEAARKADVAILCMGDNEETSGENFDRTDLNLPGRQLELVKAVYATGTPVVLVLQSGRPVTANWENDHLPAILEAWFPGEQGGTAIARTLFGDAIPGGRLPITFPRSVGQIPCHYSRRPGGGKKYVEMDWMPLYPFGYGLTYTTFAYHDLRPDRAKIAPDESVTVSFTVENTGAFTGDAVPQLYVRDLFSSVVKPERQLAAFTRVTLAPGEKRCITLTVGSRQLRTLGADYVWRVEPGQFELQLGDNAENILLRTDLTVE